MMREADRPAFDVLIEQLFGAFPNVPLTAPRRAAYWAGLAEMAIELLERCVQRAIGPQGEDRIPSATRLWEISRELRVRPDVATNPNRPSTQYLLNCYVLKRFALARPQIARPWTYLYVDHSHAIAGVLIPAVDGFPAIRVMVSDVDLDAVWQEEQQRVTELRRRRDAQHAQPTQPITIQGVLPSLTSPTPPAHQELNP